MVAHVRRFGKQSDTADRLMSSAKNYVALMQSMLAAATGKMQAPVRCRPGPTPCAMVSIFQVSMQPCCNNPMAAMLKGISGQGAQGFESCRKT